MLGSPTTVRAFVYLSICALSSHHFTSTTYSHPHRLIGLAPSDWKEVEAKEAKADNRPPLEVDPSYSPQKAIFRYLCLPLSIVDMVSTFPGIITSIGGLSSAQGTEFIRTIRLVRVFRLIKLNRGHSFTATIMQEALQESLPAMMFIGSITVVILIVAGSIFELLEGGNFRVTPDFPNGEYYRSDLFGTSQEVTSFDSVATAIYFSASPS